MKEEGDNQVIKCSADGDCDIAKSACCIASSKPAGGGEYTNLLVLLPHHYSRDVHNKMYMQTTSQFINICILQDTIGTDMAHSLLFIHALTGCDTTSRPYVRYRKSIRENILSRVTRHMQKLMMQVTKHL